MTALSEQRSTDRPAERAAPSGGRPLAIPPAAHGSELVLCDNLVRIFKVADLEVVALQGLDLQVDPGEMIAIVGASGSGKSTLLNILGGLDAPTAGRAVVAGRDLGRLSGRERARYRRRTVGMVWQQTARNLLPYLTAAENVALPMALDGRAEGGRVDDLLGLVGMTHRSKARADRLSGGEQQRVAIAVALANEPALLLADEPTGELDTATSAEVFEVLRRLNRETGTTVLIVTHDPGVAEQVERTVAIRDGRTSSVTLRRVQWSENGDQRLVAEEFAVLDRAGRLQLPRSHLEALGLAHRVRVRLERDHVSIWPEFARPPEPAVEKHPGNATGDPEAGDEPNGGSRP